MVKNAWKIYKKDLKIIFSNYAALIVFIALCILPSLYAWFNIKASWDPYAQSATSQIKIGVVSNDVGSEFNGKKINIGEKVIENLKENTLMGWQFGSAKEVAEKVENGEYYASIVIPEKFSEEILSIVSDEVVKGKLIYTVNEKINAIAPKLTDKGASGVQSSINETVIGTISDTVLSTAKELGIEVEDIYLPKLERAGNILSEIQGKFGEINRDVDLAGESLGKADNLLTDIKNYMPNIDQLFVDVEGLTKSINGFIENSNELTNKISPSIKEDIKLINEICGEINTYVDGIIEAIKSGEEKAPEMIESLISKINSIQSTMAAVQELLEKLDVNNKLTDIITGMQTNYDNLEALKATLQEIKSEIEKGVDVDYSKFDKIKEAADRVSKNTDYLYNNYDSEIHNKINEIFNNAETVGADVLKILEDSHSKLPELESLLSSVLDTLHAGEDGVGEVKNALPTLENKISEVAEKVNELNNNEDVKKLLDLIKNNVTERVDFLTTPVEIEENTLYPMHNYGSAMTPFYSVLAIWVGMTFLVSMLSLHVHGEYREVEVYFGKLLTFGTIAIIQSLIIGLGDLYLLKIYCVNPVLLMVGLVFTSITFLFIVYTLTSVFGNVGKVVAIIFMILQVAGSGGTFPIQLIPKFFQVLNPFLPFTYAISFAREAIGGVYRPTLVKDIAVMSMFIAGSLVIGVFLKKPFNKLMKGFTEKYEESGLGE